MFEAGFVRYDILLEPRALSDQVAVGKGLLYTARTNEGPRSADWIGRRPGVVWSCDYRSCYMYFPTLKRARIRTQLHLRVYRCVHDNEAPAPQCEASQIRSESASELRWLPYKHRRRSPPPRNQRATLGIGQWAADIALQHRYTCVDRSCVGWEVSDDQSQPMAQKHIEPSMPRCTTFT